MPQRPLRGQPGHAQGSRPDDIVRPVRPRPSELAAEGRARTTRRVALGGLGLGALALAIAGWQALAGGGGGDSCQRTAWDAVPAQGDLPAGWTVTATQYDIDRATLTLLGPVPQDEGAAQAVLYATVTCYAHDAADAVDRSADAATAAGQAVTRRTDLGDQGFIAVDPSQATFMQFRHGSVVVYLSASSDATAAEVDGVAGAFDLALGGDGAQAPVGTPDASPGASTQPSEEPPASEVPSDEAPSETPAAAELESRLPTSVAGTTLLVDSAVGTEILSDDQVSRAITAALRDAGRTPDDLRVAQAYDETEALDLSILAVRVEGMEVALVHDLVVRSWLSAGGAGMTSTTVTMGGREFTKLDYGDEGTVNYVTDDGDSVIVIESADPTIAQQAAEALP